MSRWPGSIGNVPSDDHTYWNRCSHCGERYHASEGHECPEMTMDERLEMWSMGNLYTVEDLNRDRNREGEDDPEEDYL